MEFVIGIGSALIGKVAEYTCNVADRRMDDYTNNVESLRAKLRELAIVKGELEARVAQAILDGHVITMEVQDWISEATRVSREAANFLEIDCQMANIKCFGKSLPNMRSRRRLSKRANEIVDELSRAASSQFSTITTRSALQSCIADRGGYEDFGTRELILGEVMAALSSDEVTKVGLYGMGGVGKTMLAQEVARQAMKEKLFSEVVFTTVSQTQDLKAIQQSVADKIRLDFGGIQSEAERADRLKRRLKEEKKILVILDDIWDALDLGMVGLNFDRDQQGCKILMTSRSRYVTHNSMGSDKTISVEALDSIEARKLFTTIVGRNVFEQRDFKELANNVVNECKGLPLAIKTVASALKDKEIGVWEDALLQLRNSAPKNIEGMLTCVYQSIRLSYDYLENEEAKRLLLLCSLYAEDMDIEVEELTTLCVGLGLFPDVYSVTDASRRVHSLVGKLKDRCLLLDGKNKDYLVKMHDVIRDVAIYIASGDKLDMHNFAINDKLEDCLSRNSIKDAKAISLHWHPNYNKLPETKLNCPQLELFLVSSFSSYHTSGPCIQINDFLQECKNIKALSLFRADLVSLPSPIHSLQNLVTLRMDSFELDDIDFIGDLKSLIVLDLSSSTIRLLPSKIGQLNRLKVLRLRYCHNLEVISENVISRLTELEELCIPHTFENWGFREVGTERRNANLDELMNLQKLTSLYLKIPDVKSLPKVSVFSQKLERYNVDIGRDHCFDLEGYHIFYKYSRIFALGNCKASLFESLIRSSECLILERSVGGVKNNGQSFPQLKYLGLDDCHDIQYVVDSAEEKRFCDPVFVSLEELRLHNLKDTKAICHGTLTEDSFGLLRKVTVKDCGRLINLFPFSVAKRLHHINVHGCEKIEEIVVAGDETSDSSTTPFHFELHTLHLDSLPKFVRFFCLPLSDVTSSDRSLFSEKVAFPKLESLTLHKMDVRKILTNELPSTSNDSMQNLSTLDIDECDNLTHLSSISTELTTLNCLKVKNCKSLEVLFVVNNKQGGEREESVSWQTLSFPELQTLKLNDLPNFKKFWATTDEEIMEFGKQESPFSKTVAVPKLENLTLRNIDLRKIWLDELPSNLRHLHVDKCDNLNYVSSISADPKSLDCLKIRNCRSLEVILVVSNKQGVDEEDTSSFETLSFPQLDILELADLPSFKKFWSTIDEDIMQLKKQEALFDETVALPKLYTLILRKMDVKKIWTDEIAPTSNTSMQNLKCLDVDECDNLKYLSSRTAAPKSLEVLTVRNCRNLEVIFLVNNERGDEEDEGTSSLKMLANIETLKLVDLPNFKKIWATIDKETMHFVQQEILFNETVVLPELHTLTLRKMNVQKLWADELQPTCNDYMKNLRNLHVDECNNFNYLSSISTEPERLDCLKIRSCRSLEVIFAVNNKQGTNEEGTSSSTKLSFPKLRTLKLIDLPKLKKFRATIDKETMLFGEQEPLFSETEFPRLEVLTLSMLYIESLFPGFYHHKLPPTSSLINMDKLKELEVSKCNKLKYLFSFGMAERLVKLKILKVRDCCKMEGIVARQESVEQDWSILFPRLEELQLHNLLTLESLCLGSESVRFPNSVKEDIIDCPKLKTFSDKK